MSLTVWFGADTADFPEGGGYLWAYMSWALGLRALGCRVVWLEPYEPAATRSDLDALVRSQRERLEPYGLGEDIALCPRGEELHPGETPEGCVPLEAAREADLFLNVSYAEHAALLPLFRRTAVVDFDPVLVQMWIDEGTLTLPHYDTYFTTGETVGQPGSRYPGGGLSWQYAPECVFLDSWPVTDVPDGAPFTTLSSWDTDDDWYFDGDDWQTNNKRDGFVPYFDLPRLTSQPLELALRLWEHRDAERRELEQRGWRIVHAYDVSATPADYQRYIQGSRGEFSCAKPSCISFQNAWISDRTLCYLASGKPAVVEHTGPSRILPDAAGLFRFRTVEEAARHLETVAGDYERQSQLARALVEEHFDARKVVGSVLERAL